MKDHEVNGCLVAQSADLVYFSGTCQNAYLYVPAEGEPVLMVRRNYERALECSALKRIVPLSSLAPVKPRSNAYAWPGGKVTRVWCGYERLNGLSLRVLTDRTARGCPQLF